MGVVASGSTPALEGIELRVVAGTVVPNKAHPRTHLTYWSHQMTHHTWVAALAPEHLAGALAGPVLDGEDSGLSHAAVHVHHTAQHSTDWIQLREFAATVDLHPATVAVLIERARHAGMFALACTLLHAGHADKLAPLVCDDPEGVDPAAADPKASANALTRLGRPDLACWFEDHDTDWNDLIEALTGTDQSTREVLFGMYVDSTRPDGDLLDAVTGRAAHLLPELNEHLISAVRWDARTAAHLVGSALPAAGGIDPWTRVAWHHPRIQPVADEATWVALLHPAGCERLTYALTSPIQDVPQAVVPALVELGREHSTNLLWALLTCAKDLHADLDAAEIAALVAERDQRDDYGWGGNGQVGGTALLTHYGTVLDDATLGTLLCTAGWAPSSWVVNGALAPIGATRIRAALDCKDADMADLLAGPKIGTDLTWDEVKANPLLLELMYECPGFLALMYRDDVTFRPDWSVELHSAFRAWVQPALGHDLLVWRTFGALMANPGAATTSELVTAALAANTPARR